MGIKLSHVLGAAAGRISKNIDTARERQHKELDEERLEERWRSRQDYTSDLTNKQDREREKKAVEQMTKSLNYFGVPQGVQAGIIAGGKTAVDDALNMAQTARKNGIATSTLWTTVPDPADREKVAGVDTGLQFNVEGWAEMNKGPDAKYSNFTAMKVAELQKRFKFKEGSKEYIKSTKQIEEIEKMRQSELAKTDTDADVVSLAEERLSWKANVAQAMTSVGMSIGISGMVEGVTEGKERQWGLGQLRAIQSHESYFNRYDNLDVKSRIVNQTNTITDNLVRFLNSKKISEDQAMSVEGTDRIDIPENAILTGLGSDQIEANAEAGMYKAGTTLYNNFGEAFYYTGIPLYIQKQTKNGRISMISSFIRGDSSIGYSYYDPQENK